MSNSLTSLTIADLQAYLTRHYQGDRDTQGFFTKLVEEVGEIAEVLNQKVGRKVCNKDDLDEALAAELADLIHYTVAIAAVHGIDLTQTILEKDKRAAIKYQHEINLEEFLKQSQN
ncbi:pyrophosphohydrolase domain-containing protein [Streptococcus cameli]